MHRKQPQRRGAVLVILTFLMAAFMVAAALSIEISRVHLARTELRTATDAAAQAVAESLSRGLTPAQARRQGLRIAAQNQVMGHRLLLAEEDFQFGNAAEEAETGRLVFSPDRLPANGVRVTSARTAASRDGAIPSFLANVLRNDFFEIRASATAAYVEQDVVLTYSAMVTE